MYENINTYKHTCGYTYEYMYMHVHIFGTYTYIHTNELTCMWVNVHIHIHIREYMFRKNTFINTCMYKCIRTYTCTYVRVHVHTFTYVRCVYESLSIDVDMIYVFMF